MKLNSLETIGLTKGEINVYEALLELGESTKTPIANLSGVSHGKVYEVLERLMRKGLVSSIKREGIKNFKVANPKNLREYIKRKKKELEDEEEIVNDLLPTLISKYTNNKKEVDVEVYTGWQGLQTIYDELISTLKKGDTDCVFGATRGADQERTETFFGNFNNRRYEKGIKLKIIYNRSDKNIAKKYITNKNLDEIRYLDLQTPAEINIYDNKVIIVILTENPLGIVITSKEAADSFKQYFNNMWRIAKK